MIEIRWHGRGGQGAKTASHLLASAAMEAGRWVQCFPEYGPERSGAPVRAYDRLDDRPIRRRSPVTRPDVAVVLDDTLLDEIDVTAGLRPGAVLIVNSTVDAATLRERLDSGATVLTVPGEDIAAETGAGRANVALLGALAAVLGEPSLSAVQAAVRQAFEGKLDAAALARACAAAERGHWTARTSEVRLVVPALQAPDREGLVISRADVEGGREAFQELPPGAVVTPGQRPRPVTGTWRGGRKPQVDVDRCVHCLLCWVYCPDMAVVVKSGHLVGFDYTVCKGCELCVEVCPVDAIEMVTERRATALRLVGGAR